MVLKFTQIQKENMATTFGNTNIEISPTPDTHTNNNQCLYAGDDQEVSYGNEEE